MNQEIPESLKATVTKITLPTLRTMMGMRKTQQSGGTITWSTVKFDYAGSNLIGGFDKYMP